MQKQCPLIAKNKQLDYLPARGPTMRHISVSSSNLASVGYDALTRTLEVAFLNGGLYSYTGVPAIVHQNLMSASSHGEYFSANIRNKYSTRKLR